MAASFLSTPSIDAYFVMFFSTLSFFVPRLILSFNSFVVNMDVKSERTIDRYSKFMFYFQTWAIPLLSKSDSKIVGSKRLQ